MTEIFRGMGPGYEGSRYSITTRLPMWQIFGALTPLLDNKKNIYILIDNFTAVIPKSYD